MKKIIVLVSAVLLISLLSGCSKLGNPSPDETAPTIASTTPADGATRIAIGTDITVTFSEEMEKSSAEGAFTISGGITGSFSWSGTKMIFSPQVLGYNTTFTCTVGTGAKDATGNSLAAAKTWSFTTIYSDDETAPTISSVVPSNDAENVSISPTISITFDEEMNKTSAQSAFLINSAAPVGTFSWAGNTMNFTPGSALSTNTIYNCTVGTGAEDLTGNTLASAYIWKFTTALSGSTIPTVRMINPFDNATQIAVSSVISATFSESMNKSSVESAFTISPSVSGNIDWTGNTMNFTPGSSLSTDTTYTCTIGTGAVNMAGNPIAADYIWNFTTILTVPPTVVSVFPSEGVTGVPVTISAITVTFSQPMNTSSVIGSINPSVDASVSWDESQKILTSTLNANLAPNTTYTWSLNGRNIAGIYMGAVKTSTFTTGP